MIIIGGVFHWWGMLFYGAAAVFIMHSTFLIALMGASGDRVAVCGK